MAGVRIVLFGDELGGIWGRSSNSGSSTSGLAAFTQCRMRRLPEAASAAEQAAETGSECLIRLMRSVPAHHFRFCPFLFMMAKPYSLRGTGCDP